MRIVFMGTPDFAVPTLDALVAAGHEVLCVVAQPDRPKGRGKQLQSPDTIVRARELGLPTRQPKAINQGPFRDWFTTLDFDVAVVVAYGRILKPWHLQAPRRGCVNVHASLLPSYRGAAPVHRAVIDGQATTGVCTMLMGEGLDEGDVLLCEQTDIGPDETTGELWARLSHMGARLLVQTLEGLSTMRPVPQDHAAATFAPPLSREDGRLDWSASARAVHDRVRGCNPAPGAWTPFRGDALKLWRTRPGEGSGAPGEVLEVAPRLVVACGQGAVEVLEAQLPGGKRLPGGDLARGARLAVGERLGGLGSDSEGHGA